jgi:hypothetical protein
MKLIKTLAAIALIAPAATVSAQSANDARCIVLASAFANQSKEPNQQKVAEDSLYFYLGRISGQPTTAQMKAAMDAQAKTITDATAGTLMGECVKAVQAKVQLLQTLAAQSAPPSQPTTKPPAKPEGR